MTIFTATNVLEAYKLARKSRKDKQEVYMFDQQIETRISEIIKDLKNRTYKHDEYKKIILHDSKKRYIYSPHFRDHILHHLVYKQIYEIIDKKMVYSTFACRKWYWAHKTIKDIQSFLLKTDKNKLCHYRAWPDNLVNRSPWQARGWQWTQARKWQKEEKLYYLKLDISKYFYSISHDKLKTYIFKYWFTYEIT